MKTELVHIGNSRGIRIPKPFIEQCGFGDKVDLRVENECLIISPERAAKHGSTGFRRSGGNVQALVNWRGPGARLLNLGIFHARPPQRFLPVGEGAHRDNLVFVDRVDVSKIDNLPVVAVFQPKSRMNKNDDAVA